MPAWRWWGISAPGRGRLNHVRRRLSSLQLLEMSMPLAYVAAAAAAATARRTSASGGARCGAVCGGDQNQPFINQPFISRMKSRHFLL